MHVDVDPRDLVEATREIGELSIATAGDRSRILNLFRDPITMNSVLDLYKKHLIQNPFLEGRCNSDKSILLRYLVRSVPSCNFLRNIPSQ